MSHRVGQASIKFLNQIEYQEVANQMNARVKEDPLGDIDPGDAPPAQTVTFVGRLHR